MILGEVGVVIRMVPKGLPASLIGATVTMRTRYKKTHQVVDYAMTVAADGSDATYTITANDFTKIGLYYLEFFASYGAQLFKSHIQTFTVSESL